MKIFKLMRGGGRGGCFSGKKFFKGGGKIFLENFMGFLAVLGCFGPFIVKILQMFTEFLRGCVFQNFGLRGRVLEKFSQGKGSPWATRSPQIRYGNVQFWRRPEDLSPY